MELGDFVESLYRANNFADAFTVFDKEVKALGFEAVLYTLIPRIVLDQSLKPVYAVSDNYCPGYLQHYVSARFDQNDPLIKAVSSGELHPIDWQGQVLQKYVDGKDGQEVIDAAQSYGIRNGLTLPLMSGARGISGASFTNTDSRASFEQLLLEKQSQLKLRTDLFHGLVVASKQFSSQFTKPVIESLNATERAYLLSLSKGNSNQQVASELGRSEKYLEQVMLRIRRKLSGVSDGEVPKINRNQVLFYAGLWGGFE